MRMRAHLSGNLGSALVLAVGVVGLLAYVIFRTDGNWALFFQLTVNGVTLGSVYALIALGYSMVYGILKLLNFAHGDVYMIGAFIGFGVLTLLGGAIPRSRSPWSWSRCSWSECSAPASRRRHRAVRLPPAARRAASRR